VARREFSDQWDLTDLPTPGEANVFVTIPEIKPLNPIDDDHSDGPRHVVCERAW